MIIPLKKKYRTYNGVLRRGAPIGGGDQGTKHSKKKKMPEKLKAQLIQPKVTLHIDKNGRRSWIKEF